MLPILTITAPIYLLIGVGWLAVRTGMLPPEALRLLGLYVSRLALPAVLFRSLSSQPLARMLDGRYLLIYGAGSVGALLLVRALARRAGRDPSLAALEGLGSACSNSAFVGLPIVAPLVGPVAGTALALCMVIENALVIPLGIALAERTSGSRAWSARLRDRLLGIARNPLFIGIALGMAGAAVELRLPGPLDRAIALLGAAAPATSLLVIGGSLVGLRLTSSRADLGAVAVGKLVLHPALVALGALLLPLPDPALRGAAVLFAAMPMLSVLPILAQPHGHERLCAALLLTVIVGSFFSLAGALWLLPAAWLPGLATL